MTPCHEIWGKFMPCPSLYYPYITILHFSSFIFTMLKFTSLILNVINFWWLQCSPSILKYHSFPHFFCFTLVHLLAGWGSFHSLSVFLIRACGCYILTICMFAKAWLVTVFMTDNWFTWKIRGILLPSRTLNIVLSLNILWICYANPVSIFIIIIFIY